MHGKVLGILQHPSSDDGYLSSTISHMVCLMTSKSNSQLLRIGAGVQNIKHGACKSTLLVFLKYQTFCFTFVIFVFFRISYESGCIENSNIDQLTRITRSAIWQLGSYPFFLDVPVNCVLWYPNQIFMVVIRHNFALFSLHNSDITIYLCVHTNSQIELCIRVTRD